MPATLAQRTTKRQERFLSIGKACNGVFALKLTVAGQSCGYYVEPIGDRLYRLEKFSVDCGTDKSETHYHVNLADKDHGCDCRGYARWHSCKHHDSLAALAQSGRIV